MLPANLTVSGAKEGGLRKLIEHECLVSDHLHAGRAAADDHNVLLLLSHPELRMRRGAFAGK